jgi:ADP-ribose pyrophosphatase
MTMQWFPLDQAVAKALSGEIVNSIAIAGIFAAHAVATGIAVPRPLDTPWLDKPTAFAKRKASQ